MNPDHLKSRKRTFGLTVEKARRKCNTGERDVNGGGEGKGRRESKDGREKTQDPLYRWKPRLPKPLQLAGGPVSPLPLRELSPHREHTGLFWWWRGTRFHRAVTKPVLPTLLP